MPTTYHMENYILVIMRTNLDNNIIQKQIKSLLNYSMQMRH